jgi:hypothetical protein
MENINEQQPVHVEHYQGTAPLTPRSTSGLAVTSMIFGILSMMGGGFFFLPPLLAVIFGHTSVSACNKNPLLEGKGMGIAGLVMGWICLAGWIVFFLFLGGLATLAAIAGASSPH